MNNAEDDGLDAYDIDVKFLNDKYGFDRKLANELILNQRIVSNE